MGMPKSLLVVVHQFNVEYVTVHKAEDNPPIAGYRHAPHPLKASLQGVEAISRQIKIGGRLRRIQVGENIREPICLIRTNPARVTLVEAFKSPVPKRPYHQDTVPCIGTDINKLQSY